MVAKKKILIIEDEPEVVMMMRARLEHEGYQVIACPDGTEGISMVHEEKPDLILLDIMMPKIDGFQVCRLLKENPETRDIPVIFVTGLEVNDVKQKVKESGADGAIQKPYEPKELLEKVKGCLTEK